MRLGNTASFFGANNRSTENNLGFTTAGRTLETPCNASARSKRSIPSSVCKESSPDCRYFSLVTSPMPISFHDGQLIEMHGVFPELLRVAAKKSMKAFAH